MGADSERCVIGKTLDATRSPKVCKIMAFMADIMGLGLLFYLLFGVQAVITWSHWSIPYYRQQYKMLFVATSQFFTPIDGCVVSECDCTLLGRGVLKLDSSVSWSQTHILHQLLNQALLRNLSMSPN